MMIVERFYNYFFHIDLVFKDVLWYQLVKQLV